MSSKNRGLETIPKILTPDIEQVFIAEKRFILS
jgi:hypothetical protein